MSRGSLGQAKGVQSWGEDSGWFSCLTHPVKVSPKGKPYEEGTMTKYGSLDFMGPLLHMRVSNSVSSHPKSGLCDPLRVPPGSHGNLKLPGAAGGNPCFIGGL